jgi:tetratricopeptide (TPR) repeat protein
MPPWHENLSETQMKLTLKSAGICLTLATLLGGCNQTSRETRNAILSYDVGDYAQAAAIIKPKTTKLDENYVLNNCRYGSCTLAAGDFASAEHAFYEAYKVINSGDTNDAGRQLQAAVVFEGVKVWKGEPFERAMADYYLGMLYLMKHDYGNARAAFQNSLFSLRQNASKDDLDHYQAVESRFALGYFGLGFTNLRLGRTDLAATNFALAQKYEPGLAQLITDVRRPGVNTLIFIDAGQGPRKAARGWYNEESVFGPTPQEVGAIPSPIALIDGRPATRNGVVYNTVDTLAMAQDRRWMDIDTIKKAKAVIGTGAMAAGAGMTAYGADRNNKNLMWAGLGTMLAGAAISASSQSDTRYWEMLPRTVYIIPATLAPGQHEVVVSAGPSRSPPVDMTAAPQDAGTPGDYIFYFRLR